jgi:membrane peptidoglycan carboxypeptidase
MSSNFLPPQNNPNNSYREPQRRTGLLSNYLDQQVPQTPRADASTTNGTRPAGGAPENFQRPPTSSLSGQFGPRGQMPPQQPQGQVPPQQPPQWNMPSFMARPVQMVQRWSAKMGAMRQPGPTADPNPLVRYRAPQPSAAPTQPSKPLPKAPEPWKLSRTQKINRLIRRRRRRWQRYGPNGKRVGLIITSVIAALLVILLVSGGVSSYAYYQSQAQQVQSLANLDIPQSTRIYDRNGALLFTLYDKKYGRGTPVSYYQIPGFMQDAQVATEDKSFWSNEGIDPQAILRSAFTDANSQQVQTGASTITQQVVKNLNHKNQQSLQRKLSEAALAIGLTQQYPKWKILEMYFNIAPYGTQELGIEAAAQDFFGLKPVCDAHFKCTPAISFLARDLTKCTNSKDETTCAVDPLLGLARATLMSSIPQNPPALDPLTNPENYPALLTRQDYVLNQMMTNGMSINLGLGSQTQNAEPINQDVINKVEKISKDLSYVGFKNGKAAPHFVRWVIQTLALALGNGDYEGGLTALNDSGFNIRTTLDSNLETYVEQAVNRHVNQSEYQPFLNSYEVLSQSDNLNDSAAVVIDAKTGEVLAMDGSVNWDDTTSAGSGQVNMALSARQPGSAFKPIVMAAAYETGFYPGIVLPDHKTYFPEGYSQSEPVSDATTYVPTDYGNTYHNIPSNIQLAISNSFNVPALKMQFYVGTQSVYNMAARLGITSIDEKKGQVPSMALGTNAVPLIQMAGAYQVFANQGVRIPPQNILDIWDNYGRHLYQYNPSKAGTRVLSQQISYLVTATLDNESARALEFAGDHVLSMWDWALPDGTNPDVAAKTGTTDSFKDNWTVGYTPDLVVGVWSGNADDSPMVNSIGVTGAAPIWHSIIEYASGHCEANVDLIPCQPLDLQYTDRHFPIPDGIILQSVNTINGLAGTGFTSYMLQGEQPQQTGLVTTDSCADPSSCGTPTPTATP